MPVSNPRCMNECQLRHVARQDFRQGDRLKSVRLYTGAGEAVAADARVRGDLLREQRRHGVRCSLVRQRVDREENRQMATDYDEVRSDVKESQESSLEALKSASAPDARSVVTQLDEADALDEGLTPGGEIVSEELIV